MIQDKLTTAALKAVLVETGALLLTTPDRAAQLTMIDEARDIARAISSLDHDSGCLQHPYIESPIEPLRKQDQLAESTHC